MDWAEYIRQMLLQIILTTFRRYHMETSNMNTILQLMISDFDPKSIQILVDKHSWYSSIRQLFHRVAFEHHLH
jgi:hypothetical protein